MVVTEKSALYKNVCGVQTTKKTTEFIYDVYENNGVILENGV
jgi:hypothetical protein